MYDTTCCLLSNPSRCQLKILSLKFNTAVNFEFSTKGDYNGKFSYPITTIDSKLWAATYNYADNDCLWHRDGVYCNVDTNFQNLLITS